MRREKLLIADDDKNIQFAFRKAFESKNIDVVSADNGNEVLRIIGIEKPNVIFMDVAMPGKNGLDVLEELNERKVEIPVIIITGFGTMNTAIKAVQLGAYDYIVKPLDIDQIYFVAERALEMVRLRNKIDNLNIELSRKTSKDEIIGNHPKIQKVYKLIGAVVNTSNTTNILITGESGTGKELVAKAIHKNSKNSERPFIALNCSVFPDSLLESELFGYEKGAFTDAKEKRIGKFELADDGTIFLDEIGDMPLNLQKKLLRVFQEREFYRLGGNNLIKLKARFIAATNKDLEKSIKNKEFRQDLFYRVNVFPIEIPPLRERGEDISLLLHHFIQKYSKNLGKKIDLIHPEVIKFINEYKFPGNVRELENFVEHAFIVSKDNVLRLSDFPIKENRTTDSNYFNFSSLILEEARGQFNNMFEKKFINELMNASKGKVKVAADIAKVDRRTIHRLIKKHNLITREFKV
ncbi:MAG: sigma-54-dependent Fis family transcriptional regulator [Bacteroidetes bacterium]|nr:sigma-54-dependent Fis family transcriptional regulator [Bacteroidota bacterium]